MKILLGVLAWTAITGLMLVFFGGAAKLEERQFSPKYRPHRDIL